MGSMTRRQWFATALTGAVTRRAAVEPYDAVVLDAGSLREIFHSGAATELGAPGSTVKPFVLAALLDARLVRPDERLACPGGLQLLGRRLECVHERQAGAFDPVEALAASCNYWFSTMARRLGPERLAEALQRYGFQVERTASPDEASLQALGLLQISASPASLVRAYARLLLPAPPPLIAAGMRAAVERGTAQRALSKAVWISGKTGTVPGNASGTTVGWFAGWAKRLAEPDAPGILFCVRVAGATGGGLAAVRGRELAERWAGGRLR